MKSEWSKKKINEDFTSDISFPTPFLINKKNQKKILAQKSRLYLLQFFERLQLKIVIFTHS